jgi:hypothetical protein
LTHGLSYRSLQSALSRVRLTGRLELGQSFVSKVECGEAHIELTLYIDWCLACGIEPGTTDALLTRQSVDPARR